jgi:hypothetical protein
LDLPRTFPQSHNGSIVENLSEHRVKIRNVIGALCSAKTEDFKEFEYLSGMTFIASFILVATNHDERVSFNFMLYVVSKCSWHTSSHQMQDTVMAEIDGMVRSESPQLYAAIENSGIPLMVVYFMNYATLFTRQSIPIYFTYFCWDKLLGHGNRKVVSILIVSLFVVSSNYLLNFDESFEQIVVKPNLCEIMITNLDHAEFDRVFRKLIRKYLGQPDSQIHR